MNSEEVVVNTSSQNLQKDNCYISLVGHFIDVNVIL